MRMRPRQRLQVPEHALAGTHFLELQGPPELVAPLARYRDEAASPRAFRIIQGQRFHHLVRPAGENDDLGISTHAGVSPHPPDPPQPNSSTGRRRQGRADRRRALSAAEPDDGAFGEAHLRLSHGPDQLTRLIGQPLATASRSRTSPGVRSPTRPDAARSWSPSGSGPARGNECSGRFHPEHSRHQSSSRLTWRVRPVHPVPSASAGFSPSRPG